MTVLCMACAATVLASARVAVPSLPEPTTPDAEVCTNIPLNVGVEMSWMLFGNGVVAVVFLCALCAICGYAMCILGRKGTSFLVVFVAFSVVATINAQKTNNAPSNMNQPQMRQGGVFLTGFTGLSEALLHTPSSLNPVNLVNPVQKGFAERKAASWNTRGAWKDSFWLAFEDGWSLPWGTNHLSGVEVVAQGEVWPTPFDTNAVASIGVAVEIVPGCRRSASSIRRPTPTASAGRTSP